MNKVELKCKAKGVGLYFVSGFTTTIGAIAATELIATCKDPYKRAKLKNKVTKPFNKKNKTNNIIKLKD